MAEFETVIGAETHVELCTRSKIFCGCPTAFGAPPNTQVCPICLGLPGVLPVLNSSAVEYAVKVGIALECQVAARFKFDRKHYYYPDLPKNFQISQYDQPVAQNGRLAVSGQRAIRVRRVHLEEDAGKLVHEGEGEKIGAGTAALVDYNRSGVPLLEIVSEPDIRTPAEAVEYLKALQAIVRYLGVSTGNMEEGSLRCEVNVSLKPKGAEKLGTKVEIKNLNSFRAVERALEHEISRQREALERGEKIAQETRLYDERSGETRTMRGKEHAHDYRYFPEPDLMPFTVPADALSRLKREMPELPAARRARFVKVYGLSEYDAGVLTADRGLADYFENALFALERRAESGPADYRELCKSAPAVNPKTACNWVTGELLGAANAAGISLDGLKVTAPLLHGLLRLIEGGTISGKIAKAIFAQMLETGEKPEKLVQEQGLTQIADAGELRGAVQRVLNEQQRSVADYRAGKKQAFGFLVGQVMKATQGKANPKLVNDLLREELEGK